MLETLEMRFVVYGEIANTVWCVYVCDCELMCCVLIFSWLMSFEFMAQDVKQGSFESMFCDSNFEKKKHDLMEYRIFILNGFTIWLLTNTKFSYKISTADKIYLKKILWTR